MKHSEDENDAVFSPPTFSLKRGRIALGLAPDHTRCRQLREAGFTSVVSLTSHSELSPSPSEAVTACGITWRWMPCSLKPEMSERDQAILWEYLQDLQKMLKDGEQVFIHCDETYRRCALLFFALCHACAIPSTSAYPALSSLLPSHVHTLARNELTWAAGLGATSPY